MLSNKLTIGDFMYISIISSVFIGLVVGLCRSALAYRKEQKKIEIDKINRKKYEKSWDSYFNCETGVIKKEKDVI